MMYEYYSPVGGTSLAFYCIEGSEPKYGPNGPAASMTKAVEALALFAMQYYMGRVRIAPQTPSSGTPLPP